MQIALIYSSASTNSTKIAVIPLAVYEGPWMMLLANYYDEMVL